jgi:fucose permease
LEVLLSLFAQEVEIIPYKAETQNGVSPSFLLKKQFPIHVFVVQRIYDLGVRENQDILTVSDLSEFNDCSKANQNEYEKHRKENKGKVGPNFLEFSCAYLLLQVEIDVERFVQIPIKSTLLVKVRLKKLQFFQSAHFWNANSHQRSHLGEEVTFSSFRKQLRVKDISRNLDEQVLSSCHFLATLHVAHVVGSLAAEGPEVVKAKLDLQDLVDGVSTSCH